MAAGRSPGTGRPAPGQTPRPPANGTPGAPLPAPNRAHLLGANRSVPTCPARPFRIRPLGPALAHLLRSTCSRVLATAHLLRRRCAPSGAGRAGAATAHGASGAGGQHRARSPALPPLRLSREEVEGERGRKGAVGRARTDSPGAWRTVPAPHNSERPPPTVPRAQELRTEENVAVSVPTGLPEAGQGRQQSGTTSGSPRVGSVRRLRRRSQQARRPGGRGSSGEKHSCHPRSTDNGCLFFWPKEAAAGPGGFPGMVGVGAGDGVRGVEWRGHAPSRQDCAGVWVPTH